MIPKVQVALLGKTWDFEYALQTAFDFDTQRLLLHPKPSKDDPKADEWVKPAAFLMTATGDLDSRDWIVLLWAGIHRADKSLTYERFLKDLALRDIGKAMSKVMGLFLEEMTGKEEEQPDPTPASPSGTG